MLEGWRERTANVTVNASDAVVVQEEGFELGEGRKALELEEVVVAKIEAVEDVVCNCQVLNSAYLLTPDGELVLTDCVEALRRCAYQLRCQPPRCSRCHRRRRPRHDCWSVWSCLMPAEAVTRECKCAVGARADGAHLLTYYNRFCLTPAPSYVRSCMLSSTKHCCPVRASCSQVSTRRNQRAVEQSLAL